jgi:hypothetical protein
LADLTENHEHGSRERSSGMARLYGPGPEDPPALIPTQDLAGLRTTDVEDRPVGQLFGALSEETTGLIRYLDVELEGASKHVLVPIGHARIDTQGVQPRVRLRAATYEDLVGVPDYEPNATAVDASYQEQLLEAHGRLFYGAHYYAHPSFDHSALYAGPSPIIGPLPAEDAIGLDDEGVPPVLPLSRLRGFSMISTDRDLRGRPVEDARGEEIGEVADLLVDPAAREARYAVIDLTDPPRQTALPVGYLVTSEEGDRLTVHSLTHHDIRVLPPYDGPLTRADENRIHAAIDGRLTGERYFQRPDFRRR